MGLEVVTKGPFQMPYGLKLPNMLGRRSLERKSDGFSLQNRTIYAGWRLPCTLIPSSMLKLTAAV